REAASGEADREQHEEPPHPSLFRTRIAADTRAGWVCSHAANVSWDGNAPASQSSWNRFGWNAPPVSASTTRWTSGPSGPSQVSAISLPSPTFQMSPATAAFGRSGICSTPRIPTTGRKYQNRAWRLPSLIAGSYGIPLLRQTLYIWVRPVGSTPS